ncbi:hypothetical protein AAFF_G00349930 [Aldrovandia affinis]|uniref:Uncharacterized protein n=1 Tax=Aldrovandia affinis TaxID=143900 RepID=A0AAD7SJA4_9TELE|nr:hypothetical protein AAFF_G00349930 [Aldrovandia affinis]
MTPRGLLNQWHICDRLRKITRDYLLQSKPAVLTFFLFPTTRYLQWLCQTHTGHHVGKCMLAQSGPPIPSFRQPCLFPMSHARSLGWHRDFSRGSGFKDGA